MTYLGDILAGPRSIEERVEHAGEGEHGEERGVQVARVLVALNAGLVFFLPNKTGFRSFFRGFWFDLLIFKLFFVTITI